AGPGPDARVLRGRAGLRGGALRHPEESIPLRALPDGANVVALPMGAQTIRRTLFEGACYGFRLAVSAATATGLHECFSPASPFSAAPQPAVTTSGLDTRGALSAVGHLGF